MGVPVIGLGAGGHARVVIETLRLSEVYQVVGMLDRDPALTGKDILGIPIIGTDDHLPELAQQIHHFFVGLGSIGSPDRRVKLYEQAIGSGMEPINVIHPSTLLSPSAKFGRGITLLGNAVINACAVLEENVIINTAAIIEHDCFVGSHAHIATGARLCGGVSVGREVHIGAGSTILQGVEIGEKSIIGAGSVVVKNVPPSVTVVGVPARIIKLA